MTEHQWQTVSVFRNEFKTQTNDWNIRFQALLQPLQQQAAVQDTPPYPLETAVVYNTALDDLTPEDDIRLIVIGDNPGKDEQRSQNRRYLVGQSGKIADGFFRRNPELNIDFRRNVIILNKTPVHTAKTAHLRYLQKHGTEEISQLILQSQLWMATKTAELHKNLCNQSDSPQKCALWLVGYAELKGKGIFLPYRDTLRTSYNTTDTGRRLWNQVSVFQHFSMNRFLIDLKEFCNKTGVYKNIPDIPEKGTTTPDGNIPLADDLAALGTHHRKEIFGI